MRVVCAKSKAHHLTGDIVSAWREMIQCTYDSGCKVHQSDIRMLYISFDNMQSCLSELTKEVSLTVKDIVWPMDLVNNYSQ